MSEYSDMSNRLVAKHQLGRDVEIHRIAQEGFDRISVKQLETTHHGLWNNIRQMTEPLDSAIWDQLESDDE